jgi:hypothetical protein
VQHKIFHVKPQVVGVGLALVLLLPATADARSGGKGEPVRTVRNPPSFESTAIPVQTSMRRADVRDTPTRAANQRRSAATVGKGLGWREAAIGVGILLGIVLLGLWGDVVVGIVVLAVADLICGTATLVARRSRRTAHDQHRAAAGTPGHIADNPTAAPSTTH